MNGAFYNENEPYAVEWLRSLSKQNHIAPGQVDARSILEVAPYDLVGFRQAHFFAGIGGWSYALRLAGWPDETPVWTGSCPCQPFSASGRKKGFADERHLWPAWFELIRECRPGIVLGEQVGSPDGLRWLDLVYDDFERADYAVGAANIPAASVGAPHIRQRLYFVAVSSEQRREGKRVYLRARKPRQTLAETARGGAVGELAYARGDERRPGRGRAPLQGLSEPGRTPEQSARRRDDRSGLGDATGGTGHGRLLEGEQESQDLDRKQGGSPGQRVAPASPWRDPEWVDCSDGKTRPVEPGTFPLAHGVPARVGKLRAYGNAIVPEQAALFIRAVVGAI